MAVQLNEAKVNRIKEIAARNGGLCEALWNCAYRNGNGWYWEVRQKAWALLERAIGKPLTEVSTVEEFWKPSVEMAVRQLTGEHWQKDFVEMMRIQLECQFSSTMVRRSYRTKNFGWHAAKLVDMLYDWIRFTLYGKTAEEMLPEYDNSVLGYGMFMALELRRGNPVFDSAVQEAILGENQNVLLTGTMIRAIIVSGREDLLELLLKLLSAARLQEGLRQQILENADAGSMQIMKRILKFCIDEDMFRYSSVVRAFYTWTGLYFGDEKPGVMQKYAHFALQCLEESKTREQYIESPNNLEAYLALWALASLEMERADCLVANLLDAGKKYRRILGWYFITHSDSKKFRMRMAARYLQERDPEILAWIVGNLAQTSDLIYSYGASAGNRKVRAVVNQDLPDDREERRRIFYRLKDLIKIVGTSEASYTGNPFPFSGIRMESDKVINCMMSLAGYDMNEELVEALHSCMPDMTPDQRRAYYHKFLRPEVNELHKAYLMEALQDKSVQVKALAAEMLAQCRLTEDDLDALAECLKSKSSSLRKNVLITLQKQEPKVQTRVLQKLLASEEQFQIQAGIELLMELKAEVPELVTVKKEAIAALRTQKLSTQTEILLGQLEGGSEAQPQYMGENGYGLYDKAVLSEVLTQGEKAFEGKALSEGELSKLLSIDKEEYFALLERMDEVFNRHANYEYETREYDGSVTKVLFGDASYRYLRIPIQPDDSDRTFRQLSVENIPFLEEFRQALGEYATDVAKMLALRFVTGQGDTPYFQRNNAKLQPWYEKLIKKPMFATYHKEGEEKYKNRYYHFLAIIGVLSQLFPEHEVFVKGFEIYRSIVYFVGMEYLGKNYEADDFHRQQGNRIYRNTPCVMNERMVGFWRTLLSRHVSDSEDFQRWFLAEYYLEKMASKDGLVASPLACKDFFRAYKAGIIPADVVYAGILEIAQDDPIELSRLTNPGRFGNSRNLYELYPEGKKLVDTLVLRIVEMEEKRGELATPLTRLACSIERFEGGAEHFVKLLAALGNENFFRGYQYGSMETKQAILSLLLKRCYPTREDGPKQLKQYLKQTDITEKRLAEAVMYAPQWASLAEQVTGWKGLKSGIWFFHAHVNEMFSAEKETEVALYSPITPRQFNDGAFDKDWFQQTYQMLGEKRFQTLYRCAKYICFGNSSHRRSQLYADAVLGKLDADVIKAEIIEKRNQEKLRCYPLIPIPEGDVKTALERYEFIQRFLKESKQFGAQRRENERKACNVAMENLAITIGFYDVNRMTWYLESEKINEIRTLMEPQKLQDVSIWVEINEEGIAQLAVEKGGKRQKSVPKECNKDPLVLELKAAIKELKEQRSRAKEILERAMAESTLFSGEEIRKISENPVLFPLIQRLVWVQEADEVNKAEEAEDTEGIKRKGAADKAKEAEKIAATELAERVKRKGAADRTKEAEIAERKEDLNKSKKFVAMILGFLKTGELLCLMDVGGTVHPLEDNAKYRVAHPHDMMRAGVWSEFMQLLYREQMVQPFKQVFREYYPITEDERQERTVSRRYAGHQVQPQKTVALLRSRGWTVDYEEGLQKVFYKENLMVRMFAMADWFSPADIEAPTLEVICFFDRNTGDVVEFTQVPPVVFSEVMRDIDLVVSVAHVGGVDPEASHSTVEMRTAIAMELTKLLKLSNVTFIGSHAKISGSLASYSVHMGSGVVHAEAIGMLNILPVHSQARGRIFLPFADDDPKTAEIMSKIILLAEDKKIKDPSVLQQLR